MSAEAEIEARARELVMYELSGKPGSHVHYARTPQQPTADEPMRIAVHERAAGLYAELIAGAPGIWDGRGRDDAENTVKGADDAR